LSKNNHLPPSIANNNSRSNGYLNENEVKVFLDDLYTSHKTIYLKMV